MAANNSIHLQDSSGNDVDNLTLGLGASARLIFETGSLARVKSGATAQFDSGSTFTLSCAVNPIAIPAAGSAGASLLLSSTAAFGLYFGSGAPTVSAAQGSVYLRSDGSSTSTRLYVNTNGATTWTNVTTAA